MTMLSFRVDDHDAELVRSWAERLDLDRSELLRQALRRHLNRLASESEADRYTEQPLSDAEHALGAVANWGPAEDWEDWVHEAG